MHSDRAMNLETFEAQIVVVGAGGAGLAAAVAAAGIDTGGWEPDTYNQNLAGSLYGFAVNSGRIAGENAAKYVSGK